MNLVLALVLSCIGIVWYVAKRHGRASIAQLPGPPAKSWLVGNIPSFVRAQNAGETDVEWTRKYGLAFRNKGCFGEDILYLSDPKALQYILNKSAYKYPKTNEARWRLRLATGNGIACAEGEQHARQRKIMNPAFSHSALRVYLPLFLNKAQRTTDKLKELMRARNNRSIVLDVSEYLETTTLDIIGEAAFGYKFDSISGSETELYRAYNNLFIDVHFMISDFTIMFRRILAYAPLWFSTILSYLPKKDIRRFNRYMAIARNIAQNIVDRQPAGHVVEKERAKDVMSIFIKANAAEDPKRQLDKDEILSQITLLLAGHETTATTLSWALYELSKHPEAQEKVRDEIRAARAVALDRGDSDITIADLDSMPYTIAVMKETLRYHAIIHQNAREAGQDDVIPLSRPQTTVSGDTITEIPVRKGQAILLSFVGYNRLQSLWGEDADSWRPERFLQNGPSEDKITLGVYGNLATFSSGVHGCIGWRFAVLEMQAILTHFIDEFNFSPPPGNVDIRRISAEQMHPMVRGEESKGRQMPLTVMALKKVSHV